jgi:KRAB domain-containing zinc finger protein
VIKQRQDQHFETLRFVNETTNKVNTMFKCNEETCGRVFSKLGNIRNHVTTHTTERPYKCHLCECEYTQKGNLMKHFGKKHPKQLYLLSTLAN